MNKKRLLSIMLFLCLIFIPLLAAQADNVGNPLIEKLANNQDWRARREVAWELHLIPNDVKSDEVRKALIDELMREYEKLKAGKMRECRDSIDCDDEVQYYSWLFDIVADMKDDRAFPFFKNLGSSIALLKYGDKGIEEILKNIESKNCGEADADLYCLEKAVEPKEAGYIAKGAVREKIKQKLIKSLNKYKHPEKGIEWYEVRTRECAGARLQIVRALGHLAETGDAGVLPTIKTLAQEDPYFLDLSKKKDYTGPQKKYLVREEAQKVLEGLKAKGIVK
jgi:hypothetical protein